MARAALHRDHIVATAVTLADEQGVDALSMRRLAQRLGTGAMSLYNHVSDKDDLLEAMVEHVLGDPSMPHVEDAGGDGWRDALVALAVWLRGVLLEHPWVCDLWWSTFPGPQRTAMMEAVLGTLRRGGFTRRMAHHGYHAFDLQVVGHVNQDVRFTIGQVDPEATLQRFLAQAPATTHPHVVEHVEHHTDPDVDEDDFAFLLGLLLDGLERHLHAP
jgi:AcrR family transcriptional regulator